MERWFYVETDMAVFGIIVEDGRIKDAAPLGGWMIGKPQEEVIAWLSARGGTWVEVPALEEENNA